jgi:hypothetical protein
VAARKAKLTPWFEAETKPVRDGQYEVQADGDRFMALFEDGKWWELEDDLTRGEEVIGVRCWRGLAAKPRAKPAKAAAAEEERELTRKPLEEPVEGLLGHEEVGEGAQETCEQGAEPRDDLI